jgi:hypothetical protein
MQMQCLGHQNLQAALRGAFKLFSVWYYCRSFLVVEIGAVPTLGNKYFSAVFFIVLLLFLQRFFLLSYGKNAG